MSIAVISYIQLSIERSYKNASLNMKRINLTVTKEGFITNTMASTAYILHRTPLTLKKISRSVKFISVLYLSYV
jgi:hypothetical protein